MALVLKQSYVNYGVKVPEGDSNIPLTGVEVIGELIDFVGRIKISQTYINKYGINIEAKYMFNLDGNSVIIGMAMIIGDRVLVSKISEKSTARQTYEKAISEKKTTCLLEKGSNGVYTVNVGNILADQEVKIEFEYLTKLECTDEGQMKFVLPTNISPKYDDGKKTVKELIATTATTSAMTYSSAKAPFQFHLNLTWRSNNGIMEVKSLTNEIEVQSGDSDGGEVKSVIVKSKTAPSNGDFNILVKTAIQPTMYVSLKGDDTYLMVNQRIADEYMEETTGEYVIIVDRSGSMGDQFDQWSGNASGQKKRKTKMDCAKEATELFVQSLPAGSRFNVVSFGSSYSSLFGTSVEYTEESKNKALEEIAKFDSNMGGTELFQCLSDVLSGQMNRSSTINLEKRVWTPPMTNNEKTSSELKKSEKIVILMTDGDVGNVDAVTGLIKQYNHCSRVFTIGIGQDVNRFLVEKVAKSSNAFSEVLVDNPDISTAVVKMLDASMKSYYKNPQLNLLTEKGGKIGEETKDWHKVIYPNQFESFYSRLPTKDFVDCRVVQMSCVNGITGKTVNWDFPINHSEDNSQENEWIPQLFAADEINRLESSNENNQNTSQIVRLSVDYSVMNDKTSFVVVDEETKVEKSSSDPLPVPVPQYSNNNVSSPRSSSIAAPSILCCSSSVLPPIVPVDCIDCYVGGNDMFGGDDDECEEYDWSPPKMPAPAPASAPVTVSYGSAGQGRIAKKAPSSTFFRASNTFDIEYDDGEKETKVSPSLNRSLGSRSSPPNRQTQKSLASSDHSDADGDEEDEEEEDWDKEFEDCRSSPQAVLKCSVNNNNNTVKLSSAPQFYEKGIAPARKMDLLDDSEALGEQKKKPEQTTLVKDDSTKMDESLKYKKVDGSFTFSSDSMKTVGWSSSDISSFATANGISEELTFNLWILKWLRGDSLKSNKKYLLIVRNLEKWLKGQSLSKTLDEFLSLISL
jgi:hypothetical protein